MRKALRFTGIGLTMRLRTQAGEHYLSSRLGARNRVIGRHPKFAEQTFADRLYAHFTLSCPQIGGGSTGGRNRPTVCDDQQLSVQFPVKECCVALGVSRSGYYQWALKEHSVHSASFWPCCFSQAVLAQHERGHLDYALKATFGVDHQLTCGSAVSTRGIVKFLAFQMIYELINDF
jgi:hypothetical protein